MLNCLHVHVSGESKCDSRPRTYNWLSKCVETSTHQRAYQAKQNPLRLNGSKRVSDVHIEFTARSNYMMHMDANELKKAFLTDKTLEELLYIVTGLYRSTISFVS